MSSNPLVGVGCSATNGGSDRLRAAAGAAMVSASLPDLRVTISAGLAPVDAVDAVETALEHADRALYRAKAEGRDRVCTDPGPLQCA